MIKRLLLVLACAAAMTPCCFAVDLSHARVVADAAFTVHEKNAVAMLVDEVEKRTALRWSAQGTGPEITIHHASGAGPAEGFRLQTTAAGVDIRGNDERGTLFGI